MIKLNDLLHLSDEQAARTKIKFNIHNSFDDPIELFKNNPDVINKQWLYWRNEKRYFDVSQIAICFVRIRGEYWLLTTIDTVTEELNVTKGINYKGTPIKEYQNYFGRTIIKFHKTFQTQVRFFTTIADDLEVCQILPDTFDDDDFPGYDNVRLSYSRLKSILDRGKKDWIAALESQKAVYLITDINTGKLYVGSATSDYGMSVRLPFVLLESGESIGC